MNSVFGKIVRFVKYLVGKRSEVADLDVKDVMLAKVVFDIHRKCTVAEFVVVPLFALKQIHTLDRENAMRATASRVRTLNDHKDELLAKRVVTKELLAEYLPSISMIKVVKESHDSYIAYEGNGRLVAMQQAFGPGDAIEVEVQQYNFRNPKKIIRRMNAVRKMYGLI